MTAPVREGPALSEFELPIELCVGAKLKKIIKLNQVFNAASGGGGGIRTRDTVSRIHTFQACAFSRSATPPSPAHKERGRGR
jgi:hypothetical protein